MRQLSPGPDYVVKDLLNFHEHTRFYLGVNNTGDKFIAGVNDTDLKKKWKQLSL